jgi:hypothetical protein
VRVQSQEELDGSEQVVVWSRRGLVERRLVGQDLAVHELMEETRRKWLVYLVGWATSPWLCVFRSHWIDSLCRRDILDRFLLRPRLFLESERHIGELDKRSPFTFVWSC